MPFIFLTARSDREDVRTGMNSGADDYLVKPVPREELLAAVEARLTRSEAVEARVLAAATAGGFAPDFSSHEPLMFFPRPVLSRPAPCDAPPGAPDRSRTCDQRFRKPLLYPSELQGPNV